MIQVEMKEGQLRLPLFLPHAEDLDAIKLMDSTAVGDYRREAFFRMRKIQRRICAAKKCEILGVCA